MTRVTFSGGGSNDDSVGSAIFGGIYFVGVIIAAFIFVPHDGWLWGLVKAFFWWIVLIVKLFQWIF